MKTKPRLDNYQDQLAALEAENRRLRAIVQQWIDWPSVPPVPNAVMRAALAAAKEADGG